jgi:hypothetical protein
MTRKIDPKQPKPKKQRPLDSASAADAFDATTTLLGASVGAIAKWRPDIAALIVVLRRAQPSNTAGNAVQSWA